ncbi:unnamed protein product [Ectocarpus sp. 12 AP-2014]
MYPRVLHRGVGPLASRSLSRRASPLALLALLVLLSCRDRSEMADTPHTTRSSSQSSHAYPRENRGAAATTWMAMSHVQAHIRQTQEATGSQKT